MSTCLIGVHAIYYREKDEVYEFAIDAISLRHFVHVWYDPHAFKVIEKIDPLITHSGGSGMGRRCTFTQDVVLLKLTVAGAGSGHASTYYSCDLDEALWEAGLYGAAVDQVLGAGTTLTLYALAREQLPYEPASQEKKEPPACSFVTMWKFHPGAGAAFLGVLDLNLEASQREAVALAGGLSQLLADLGKSLSEDAYRAVASAEAYLRRLAVDPRWPAAEIRAQLTLTRESLDDGATAEQADLLRELARRFGVSADATSPAEM